MCRVVFLHPSSSRRPARLAPSLTRSPALSKLPRVCNRAAADALRCRGWGWGLNGNRTHRQPHRRPGSLPAAPSPPPPRPSHPLQTVAISKQSKESALRSKRLKRDHSFGSLPPSRQLSRDPSRASLGALCVPPRQPVCCRVVHAGQRPAATLMGAPCVRRHRPPGHPLACGWDTPSATWLLALLARRRPACTRRTCPTRPLRPALFLQQARQPARACHQGQRPSLPRMWRPRWRRRWRQ